MECMCSEHMCIRTSGSKANCDRDTQVSMTVTIIHSPWYLIHQSEVVGLEDVMGLRRISGIFKNTYIRGTDMEHERQHHKELVLILTRTLAIKFRSSCSNVKNLSQLYEQHFENALSFFCEINMGPHFALLGTSFLSNTSV